MARRSWRLWENIRDTSILKMVCRLAMITTARSVTDVYSSGLINQPWDNAFFDRMVDDPEDLATMEHVEYVREAGSEGIELVMWLVARGAMSDLAGGTAPSEVHRHYHVPASNTAVGQLILEDNS